MAPTRKRSTSRATSTPTLKNTWSASPRVFDDIQKTLATHRARSIMLNYDNEGRVSEISFWLESAQGTHLSYRMPARVGNVERIFEKSKGRTLTEVERQRAYQTAWANIRDWLSAQFALIDTKMVAEEEIFLPYLLDQGSGQTLYEVMARRQFLLDVPKS